MKRRHFKQRNLLFLGLFVLCLPILIAAGLSAVGAVLAALLLCIPLYFFCFVLRLPAWQISKHRKETEDIKSAREEGRDAAQKISEEGIVLLKNEDGLLPLETERAGKVKKSVRINLFGRCCIQTFYNGSGSAASDISRCTSVTEALESDGRFEVNRDLLHLYLNYIQKGKPSIEKSGQSAATVKINRGGAEFLGKRPELMLREMPLEYLITDTLYGDGKNMLEHAREFSEYAVVVLGRGGVEGFELRPRELQLNEGERKLLDEVSRYFDKVILILNTANPLELGCLDEYPSVKSVLWMGLPGTVGTCALARIVSGEVNPSGRLADTWTKDHMAAPACNNFQVLKDNGDWNEKSWHLDNYKENQGYVIHYEEGIYVGYRYFETRYRTDSDYRYEDEVLFPFGYGLSYTSFRQQISGFCQEGDELILKVRVENTGDRPGREVIQIYADPPYTGKIEKAFSLTAFAKTDILAPGEGEEHTFRIPAEDFASFDDREEKAYVLEKGTYEICLMKNAHEKIESVTWDVKEDVVYRGDRDGKRKTDRVEATARFDSARPAGKILTRKWEKDSNAFTGPDSSFLHVSKETLEELDRPVRGDGELGYTDADIPASGVKYPAKILWDDMKDVRFDDPKWDAFVSQLTVGELCSLCGNGAWHTEGIRRLGIPKRLIPDGSTGICSTLFSGIVMSNAGEGTGYPSPVVAASTWDETVAEQLGEAAGKEARSLGYHGWYAPAMNCHRTPFNARNFEYYSEDGLLSGKIAAATVRGAGKEGIVCFLKHFALNERESAGRNQLLTYCTEQAMREIYLKPFEIAVKEGGAAGIMTSFNYIGNIWAGADRALLTDVLRGEWGFRGVVSTDACVYPHMDVKKMLEAGGDLSLDSLGGFVGGNIKRLELLKASADRRTKVVMAKNLHRAGKNILYAFRNAERGGEKMRIRDIRINGIAKPKGFDLENPAVSWKVDQTESTEQKRSRIRLFSSEKGILCWEKEGALDPLGEQIECELKPRTDYHLCITVWGDRGDQAEGTADFFTGKMKESWKAEWIGTRSEDTFHPVFEKRFSARKNEIRDAKLYICGLGLFEAYVNGRKAGEEYLAPYYNNYKYEQQIMAYDVTELLSEENTLEVFLGNGWYKGRFAMNQKEIYGDRFALTAELHIRYADGSEQVILTDETWDYRGSDIQESDIYDGETINRLLWEKGTDNLVRKAQILTMSKEGLTDRYSLPVLIKERIPVKEVIHTPAGETVLDMGQNFAGWMEFRSSLPRGTKVVLDFGEVLQEGNFYNANYRTAKSRFVYVSDGREELVRPHFTYFGFRYVRVSGWEGELNPEDFTGCVLYSDLERTGYFTCDNEKVNRLYENTLWGMKSNFIDMPTDCPQRDERLGWTGDAQVFAPTASLHMDTRVFFEKFLRDLRHYQEEMKGGIPVCIPEADSGGNHMTSAVWSDIATILPMRLYQVFGDIQILRKWYPMMKEWVDSVTAECRQHGEDHYLWDFGFQFGDWLALDGPDEQSCQGGTEEYFISGIYYYQSTKLTCEAARILSEDPGISDKEREVYKEQSQGYRDQMKHIYDTVLEEYFTPAGRLALDTQTAYVIALRYGVYRKKEKLLEQFRKRLKKDDFKLQSGFVGAPLLCQTLRENGMEDLAWQFLLNEEYPGWLYCVNLGATTIWERWNSIQPDGRISENGMNSLNHYSYGSVAQFLYEDAAGIRCVEPGYRKVCFAPCINAGMRHVRASYDSPQGQYVSEWEIREDGTVWIHCEVPFGGRAVLDLPRYDGEKTELSAGVYEMSYTPLKSYLVRFTEETRMKEILDDPKGASYIMEQAPAVWGICSMGGDACREMTVKEILGVAVQMCGMSKEEAVRITEGIKKL